MVIGVLSLVRNHAEEFVLGSGRFLARGRHGVERVGEAFEFGDVVRDFDADREVARSELVARMHQRAHGPYDPPLSQEPQRAERQCGDNRDRPEVLPECLAERRYERVLIDGHHERHGGVVRIGDANGGGTTAGIPVADRGVQIVRQARVALRELSRRLLAALSVG